MGNICPGGDDPNRKRSLDIDAALRDFKAQLRKEQKILLLGPGESGKSTVFKQMKIIQDGGGFSNDELMSFKHVVHMNCISQMRVLVQASARQRQPFQNQMNVNYAAQLLQLPAQGNVWSTEIGLMLKALWNDSGVRAMYAMAGSMFQLNDSAGYFFDGLDRFIQPDYCPSVDDVLRVRVRSTGIEEASFSFDKMIFRVMDVGGQRSERRKWIHCFDNVTAVLYCAALSCYDQVLREDRTVNRMVETLELFEDVANSPYFNKTKIILFLNKKDLFAEKLQRGIDLALLFPGYTGGFNYDLACAFIKARFRERFAHPHPDELSIHETCAVDSKNIQYVINEVRKKVLIDITGQITNDGDL